MTRMDCSPRSTYLFSSNSQIDSLLSLYIVVQTFVLQFSNYRTDSHFNLKRSFSVSLDRTLQTLDLGRDFSVLRNYAGSCPSYYTANHTSTVSKKSNHFWISFFSIVWFLAMWAFNHSPHEFNSKWPGRTLSWLPGHLITVVPLDSGTSASLRILSKPWTWPLLPSY